MKHQMSGTEYEEVCADYLKSIGYRNVRLTRNTGDNGIDILAEKNGKLLGVQCKCYFGHNVGVKAVQEAYAGRAFYECDEVAVFTNSVFTRQAVDTAAAIGVTLYDELFPEVLLKNRRLDTFLIVLFVFLSLFLVFLSVLLRQQGVSSIRQVFEYSGFNRLILQLGHRILSFFSFIFHL